MRLRTTKQQLIECEGVAAARLFLLLFAGMALFGCQPPSGSLPAGGVAVAGVGLDTESITLNVGATRQLMVTISPVNASNQNVTWSTSDGTKATVDRGLVTAVAVGSATITVSTEDGGKIGTCAVTVSLSAVPAATPTMSPNGGSILYTGTVSLSTDTAGASMAYTTDGTTPAEYNGSVLYGTTLYTGPFTLSPTTTIVKAIAFKTGNLDSAVASATFTVETAVWANSASGPAISVFNGVATDASGNSYAAGSMNGAGTYSFGGVSANGSNSSGPNVLLVKYDSSGMAKWARSVSATSEASGFRDVAVDGSGNCYAVGYVNGKLDQTVTYTFDTGVSLIAPTNYTNTLLVKYDSSGAAQWVRSVTAGAGYSDLYSVAVDGSNNVYVAGYVAGTGSYTFAAGVSVNAQVSGNNTLLVKYDSSGTAQWARTVTNGTAASFLYSVALDGSGNPCVGGYISGTATDTFGSVTTAGATSGSNALVVKYNSSGTAQWARSVTAGVGDSIVYSVAADASGNVCAAGTIANNGTYTFGTVSVNGTYAFTYNALLVQYDSSGTAKWARSVSTGSSTSAFYGVAVDGTGNVFAAGALNANGVYTFGTGVTAQGAEATDFNPVLVKYGSSGTALWTRTALASSGYVAFGSVAVNGSGKVAAAGSITGTCTVGGGVSVSGSSSALLVSYYR